MQIPCRALIILAAAAAAALPRATDAGRAAIDLENLYRTHQWFELRAAVTKDAPPLMRAAVAVAFNDPVRAESLLRDVIDGQPRSSAANDAYGLLSRIHLRSGRYARFVDNHRRWVAAFPDSEGAREVREDVYKFSGRPDQRAGPRRDSTLRHGDDGFAVPVTINGKTDEFLIDTGAWQSVVTEPEAKKLGLTIREGTRTLVGSSGETATFRTAVAPRLAVGAMSFRDVSFAVINFPWAPDAEVGIVGMPIILAAGGIRWARDGSVEIGVPAATGQRIEPNLVFDRNRLLLRAGVLGQRVLTTLDTGATTTDLNANFADAFADVVRRGKKGTQEIAGAGGTRTFDSIELPELTFAIGSFDVLLRPAHVTMQRIALIGGDCCVGNVGRDLLAQRSAIVIDLSTMTLRLE
jgi:predicted aspartyl protease